LGGKLNAINQSKTNSIELISCCSFDLGRISHAKFKPLSPLVFVAIFSYFPDISGHSLPFTSGIFAQSSGNS
jgi:hypothetical protein